MASLVANSLVWQEPSADGTTRYRMLETIREFALTLLERDPDEVLATRRAHAAYFLSLAARSEHASWAPGEELRLVQLGVEHANLQAALGWFDESGEVDGLLRLAGVLRGFWLQRGYVHEARAWLERALTLCDTTPTAAYAKAMTALSSVLAHQSAISQADALFPQALALLRAVGEPTDRVIALASFASVANNRGDHDQATALLEEALGLARGLDDPGQATAATATVLANLGVAAMGRGEFALAASYHDEALALRRTLGRLDGVLHSLLDLGDVAREQGDHALALARYCEVLAHASALGANRLIVGALEAVAVIAAESGQAERAARLFGASERLWETTGFTRFLPAERAAYDRGVAVAVGALGESAFAAAWKAGWSLTLEAAAAEATRPFAPPGRPVLPPLTRREGDVLRGLIAGKTDRLIADELYLSRRTVEEYVSNLLTKFGVRTRSEAAAYAVVAGFRPDT